MVQTENGLTQVPHVELDFGKRVCLKLEFGFLKVWDGSRVCCKSQCSREFGVTATRVSEVVIPLPLKTPRVPAVRRFEETF